MRSRSFSNARVLAGLGISLVVLSLACGAARAGGPASGQGGVIPLASFANGCGGSGWSSLVKAENYLGDSSVYRNSNSDPTARSFKINFKAACDLHDACYAGVKVQDSLHRRVTDFRTWTRHACDTKFLADMRLLCAGRIGSKWAVALRNCKTLGGNFSFGAQSRYWVVRICGDLFFDADPTKTGVQSRGHRLNDIAANNYPKRFIPLDLACTAARKAAALSRLNACKGNWWQGTWTRVEHAGEVTFRQKSRTIASAAYTWFGIKGSFTNMALSTDCKTMTGDVPPTKGQPRASTFEIELQSYTEFTGHWRWATTPKGSWDGGFSGRKQAATTAAP